MALNAKQARFVEEYLVDLNATQAAIRAGYSKASARKIGHDLLTKPDIRAATDKALQERGSRVRLTADDVLRELAALVKSSIAHYSIDENGEVQLTDDAPTHAMGAVASVKKRYKTDENGNVVGIDTEYRLWSKTAALELAAKHLGMLVDRVEVTHKKSPRDYSLEELEKLAAGEALDAEASH